MPDLSAHHQVVRRLVERLYDQPVIDNVDRGVYVQYMVELALREHDERWEGKSAWEMWNLEHTGSGARICVRQSAARQIWEKKNGGSASPPAFNIKRTRYWDAEVGAYRETKPQRWADLYVFAYHPGAEAGFADHRIPDQWEFYLVPERILPGQKSIGLGPLRRLARRCYFPALGAEIIRIIDDLPLKAHSPFGR